MNLNVPLPQLIDIIPGIKSREFYVQDQYCRRVCNSVLGSMKRWRYIKLMMVFLPVLSLFFYYVFNDKIKYVCSPFLKCIVIGNGGVLRNRNLGEKINSYDVVIRLNKGPVIGYENDVGNKTTFRFCYPESFFNDRSQHDVNTTIVFIPFKSVDLRWLKEVLLKKKVSLRGFWKKPPLNLIYKNNQIRILNPSIVQRAAFKLLNLPKTVPWLKPPQYPTTGIIAISMAFTMCDVVHIAGFKYDAKNPNSTLHYYGKEIMSSMNKMVYHDVRAEQLLLNDLRSSNRIFDLTGNF
ncbi:type 2 lactosamine alpha-2,3-sialyltransferase-like isoform X14 [Hypanus sabinus]|uniref:type 2 lactosamine alpha-2,3-sialyltransferase-like isoform X14 n=1 Tax=Hypanus sabinus TaxID=79690 RepID=UPI0028C475CA|nr:type 2 lactosamine alpha-2,3-sialyltransferase-like isoform X14 [Hypanus sabinus]